LSSSNHVKVPGAICQAIEKELGMKVGVLGHEINRTNHFPFLSFNMNEMFIDGSHFEVHNKRLLDIEQLKLRVHPWNLLRKKYTIRHIQIKNSSIRLFRDSLDASNMDFLKKLTSNKQSSTSKENKKPSEEGSTTFDLDRVELENVYFDLTNDRKN